MIYPNKKNSLNSLKVELENITSSIGLLDRSNINQYIPYHYKIEELVYIDFYKKFKANCIWWFDPYLLWSLDAIWVYISIKYNKTPIITINDYIFGGNNQYRGLRPFDCSVGVKYSQHKFGKASDFSEKEISPKEIYEEIIEN